MAGGFTNVLSVPLKYLRLDGPNQQPNPSHPANGPLHQQASRQAYKPYHFSIIMPSSGMLFPLQESGTVAMAVETTLHVHSLGCLRHCLVLIADGLSGVSRVVRSSPCLHLHNRSLMCRLCDCLQYGNVRLLYEVSCETFPVAGMEYPDRPEMLLIGSCS